MTTQTRAPSCSSPTLVIRFQAYPYQIAFEHLFMTILLHHGGRGRLLLPKSNRLLQCLHLRTIISRSSMNFGETIVLRMILVVA